MTDATVAQLPDGRSLAWVELGVRDGPVVFGLHGTPGSSRQMAIDDKPIREAGVRFICPDRPGYGLSSFHRGRTLAGFADDIAWLADHLGIERFSVIGVSGGGPHAAACAWGLPDRVVGAGLVSGVGPLHDPGAEDGMMAMNRLVTRMTRRAPAVARPPFALIALVGRRWPERAMKAFEGQIPPADAEVLRRPEVRAAFFDDLRHASRTSARAAVQDFTLFARDWGFRLEDISVPVHLWQGDVDRNVPAAHARMQAQQIPGAVLHECLGEGHLLVVDHQAEILRTVSGG